MEGWEQKASSQAVEPQRVDVAEFPEFAVFGQDDLELWA